MKVVVLGSGVVGVTTAWYLAEAGHEVVVIDRQPGPALETSFANAGQISPGYASPWAAPGIPAKALRWMFMKHAPLILRPTFDPNMAAWLMAMLRNCTAERYAINKSRMVRLATFSRECLIALRESTGLHYDERRLGTLQLFRTQKQLDAIAKDVAVLQADGIPFEVLDPAGCRAAEPGLAHSQAAIAGGLRLPDDETGDCFAFTNALATRAAERGVRFVNSTRIDRLVANGNRISAVMTNEGPVSGDAYVLALGSFSPAIARGVGLRVPVYPVKGYSMTIPIADADRAPVSTLLDESYKVAVTRLGDRIRVGGMAELSGYEIRLPQSRRATLEQVVRSLFPGAGDLPNASFWSGLRPMTPDSTPIIGPTRLPNLYLNTGHGTLGWTMACGSGQILADMISGREPAIETRDLALSRYGAH